MLVKQPNNYILNEWADTPINRQRIAAWGLEIYTGETQIGCDGGLYVAGHAPDQPAPSYAELRAGAYPTDVDQLDMLYHDIDNGLWGETAKTSSFYLARKAVKNAYPKLADETDKETNDPAPALNADETAQDIPLETTKGVLNGDEPTNTNHQEETP